MIATVIVIFVYLFYAVIPLFMPADAGLARPICGLCTVRSALETMTVILLNT